MNLDKYIQKENLHELTPKEQFDKIYSSGDLAMCIELFKRTEFSFYERDFYMLDKLSMNYEKYTEAQKNLLLKA